MNPTKKIREACAALTDNELEDLKRLIDGYGWLKESARKAEVHVNTIRNVLRLGYGHPTTIHKLRNILARENRPYQSEQD